MIIWENLTILVSVEFGNLYKSDIMSKNPNTNWNLFEGYNV